MKKTRKKLLSWLKNHIKGILCFSITLIIIFYPYLIFVLYTLIRALFTLFSKIQFNQIIIGITPPILAACIAYYLAQKAIKRKESNQLYIQIELFIKELIANQKKSQEYIKCYKERVALSDSLKILFPSISNLLIDVLEMLTAIGKDYIFFNNTYLNETPTVLLVVMNKIKELNEKIDELMASGYGEPYPDSLRLNKIARLDEEKAKYQAKADKNNERNLFNELLAIQLYIERNAYGKKIFEIPERRNDNLHILELIYDAILEFNETPNKGKDAFSILYEKIRIFDLSQDILVNGSFDQANFELSLPFDRSEGDNALLYQVYEKYYKLLSSNNSVENYIFDFSSKTWQDQCSDFVLISDSNLYIAMVDLYETLSGFTSKTSIEDNEKVFELCLEIDKTISIIFENLNSHKSKLKRWIK